MHLTYKTLVSILSQDILAKIGAQLLEMSMTEKVPSVMVLILHTVHTIGQTLNDKNFNDNAKIMYNTLLNDPDSDVSHYAKLYSTSTPSMQ